MPRPAAFNPEEKIYTVKELEARLRFDRHTIVRLFLSEHGVRDLSLTRPRVGKPKNHTLRIPHSAVARVLARMAVK